MTKSNAVMLTTLTGKLLQVEYSDKELIVTHNNLHFKVDVSLYQPIVIDRLYLGKIYMVLPFQLTKLRLILNMNIFQAFLFYMDCSLMVSRTVPKYNAKTFQVFPTISVPIFGEWPIAGFKNPYPIARYWDS